MKKQPAKSMIFPWLWWRQNISFELILRWNLCVKQPVPLVFLLLYCFGHTVKPCLSFLALLITAEAGRGSRSIDGLSIWPLGAPVYHSPEPPHTSIYMALVPRRCVFIKHVLEFCKWEVYTETKGALTVCKCQRGFCWFSTSQGVREHLHIHTLTHINTDTHTHSSKAGFLDGFSFAS